MKYFVDEYSIVRKIWGESDTILLIFAGAAAEFALNKAVDWLYYTGKLPADPLGRLFSTVKYAKDIVYAENEEALRTINRISAIHRGIERQRGAQIPDWAYRDVLFMLIDYSIRAFEVMHRRLTPEEREEVYQVFYRVGTGMKLRELPATYEEWVPVRKEHLENDLEYTPFTKDLFAQYRKHLGPWRYRLLMESQKMVVPEKVKALLQFGNVTFMLPLTRIYKVFRSLGIHAPLRTLILPRNYLPEIRALDQ